MKKYSADDFEKKFRTLYKKLLFKECEESPEGHHFIDNSGTDSQSGRDMEESKICTKCGFEKKA